MPWVTPHHAGALNKFGLRPARRYQDQLEGHSIQELVAQFGSPLFVTSENCLRQRARQLRRAFESCYPGRVIHGWSYKTNYTSAICKILHQEGCWAEVVSRFEYEKARSLGVAGNQILFNGPNKGREILRRAVQEGAHIHVDHFDELATLESIAVELDQVVEVTLRISLNTGYSEPWTRFGFHLESGQAWEAAMRIRNSPHLRLTGLHSHIGTFILEPLAYAEQIRLMCQLMQDWEASGGSLIERLDIGGGLPSQNSLQGIYLPPSQVVPDLDTYCQHMGRALQVGLSFRQRQGLPWPDLVFEAGRATVDESQHLISTVVANKWLPDGRPAAVLDAGLNTLFTALWYNHRVEMTRPAQGVAQDTVLYGPLCMNIDVVRQSVSLPPLRLGDQLLIGPVGAYNNTQWMQFIEYRPAIVLLQTDGQVSVIREAENLQSMCSHDRLPEHLQ